MDSQEAWRARSCPATTPRGWVGWRCVSLGEVLTTAPKFQRGAHARPTRSAPPPRYSPPYHMSATREPQVARSSEGKRAREAQAALANGEPPAKRSASAALSMTGLQRELQMEVERRCRLEESVEQLRLELQLMGRLLAAAREQFVACGAPPAPPGVATRTAPKGGPGRPGRSKTDARLVQRLQDELNESKGQTRRLGLQVESLKQQLQLTAAVKKELLGIYAEANEYVVNAPRA